MRDEYEVFEISGAGCDDIPLDDQIRMGANQWKAETSDGAWFYGDTEQEVRDQAEDWLGI